MQYIFTKDIRDNNFKSEFRSVLLNMLKEHGRDIDRHDPLVNPFEYDNKVYDIDFKIDVVSLAQFYFEYLDKHVFTELFDTMEDDLYEMTAAHHG